MSFFLLIIVALWLLAEVLSVVGIVGWMPSAARCLWYRWRNYIVIDTPDDLRTAAANRLIRKGGELVAGFCHEGSADRISRFAVHPTLVGCPAGAVLRVVSMGPRRLVLERMA